MLTETPAGARSIAARKRLLVADASGATRSALREVLGAQMEVRLAENAGETLALARSWRPDIVLLDVHLPGGDGRDICRSLRSEPALEHVKIILVSARCAIADRLEGYEAGADDFVAKPFDEQELLSKIRVFLRLQSIEKVDRLKGAVLALCSHEVFTPLNGIVQPAYLLQSEDEVPDDTRRRFGEMIHRSVASLQDFFDKVASLSDLRCGRRRLRLVKASAGEVVESVARAALHRAAERRVRIEIDRDGDPCVLLDRKELSRVVRALVDNAIRFSPEGGTVTVRSCSEGADAVIAVIDRGEGIGDDMLPRVFDEFACKDIHHHAQGHGLSLALSRHIVEQLGGSLSAASRPGGPTCFTVRLPSVGPVGRIGAKILREERDARASERRQVHFREELGGPGLERAQLATRLVSVVLTCRLAGDHAIHELLSSFEEILACAAPAGGGDDGAPARSLALFEESDRWGISIDSADDAAGDADGAGGSAEAAFLEILSGRSVTGEVMDEIALSPDGASIELRRLRRPRAGDGAP